MVKGGLFVETSAEEDGEHTRRGGDFGKLHVYIRHTHVFTIAWADYAVNTKKRTAREGMELDIEGAADPKGERQYAKRTYNLLGIQLDHQAMTHRMTMGKTVFLCRKGGNGAFRNTPIDRTDETSGTRFNPYALLPFRVSPRKVCDIRSY